MSTLIKMIVASILSLSLFSCPSEIVVPNIANVTTKERTIANDLNRIKVSRAEGVYLMQSALND